jgi:hypothetical protein
LSCIIAGARCTGLRAASTVCNPFFFVLEVPLDGANTCCAPSRQFHVSEMCLPAAGGAAGGVDYCTDDAKNNNANNN